MQEDKQADFKLLCRSPRPLAASVGRLKCRSHHMAVSLAQPLGQAHGGGRRRHLSAQQLAGGDLPAIRPPVAPLIHAQGGSTHAHIHHQATGEGADSEVVLVEAGGGVAAARLKEEQRAAQIGGSKEWGAGVRVGGA